VFRDMLMRAMLEMQERVYVWSGGVGVCDPSLLFLLEVIYRECNERDHDRTEVDKEEFAASCGIRVNWVVGPSDGCGLRIGLWVALLWYREMHVSALYLDRSCPPPGIR